MRINLKLFRVSKNLTQGEFAELAGVNRTTYSFIEKGTRNGKVEFWDNIQKAFNIPDEEMYKLMKIE